MDNFDRFVSNTLAANGNQMIYKRADNGIAEAAVFIKPFLPGAFEYVFAYSAAADSTFGDGSVSVCNEICPDWKIESLRAFTVDEADPGKAEKSAGTEILFAGKAGITVSGAEPVFTDPVSLNPGKGQYICLVMRFSGESVPCHEETIIPVFIKSAGEWVRSPKAPVPLFTGVDRTVKKRMAFIGDSITQGIGTMPDSYKHCAALIADRLGAEYACWNLGLGYARGSDAASDGVWLSRAKHNDVISVCFGVNDMFQGHGAEQVKTDLKKLVIALKNAGLKVLIQTVPPFDYDERYESDWRSINDFIRSELAPAADAFFDNVAVLSANGKDSPKAKYGGHPDAEGNAAWAKAIFPVIEKLLSE